jgi:membrane fusion protein (multidrug efflux system)
MKRGEKLLAAMLLALVAAGCGSESSEKPAAATPPGSRSQAQPAASSGARPGSMQAAREIPSVLTVEREVDVLAQRQGAVVELAAEEGATVEKGALLARLDDRSLQAQLEKARADVRIAESNVKFNEAELKANEAHYQRAKLMFDEGLGSKAELDAAEFKAKGSAYDVESWKAGVEKNRAELRGLEVELEKSHIRAPFHGVVTRRYIRDGQTVLNSDKCFRLSQLSPLLVEFLVSEIDPHRPAVGMQVRGTLVNDPSRTFEARIQRVGPVVDAASGSYNVTAELLRPDADLKPGMAVRVAWTGATPPKQ